MVRAATARTHAFGDWSSAGHPAHIVQFYDDERTLVQLLSPFVGSALVKGDAAVVIVTKAHRIALLEHLKSRGLDTHVAVVEGRFATYDAAEALEQIMQNGWPDAARFGMFVAPVVAGLKAAATGPAPQVVAFGEMVAVLWADGKFEQALRLEELWAECVAQHDIALCCAYPMEVFKSAGDAAPFLRICAQHSHVFPTPGRRAAAGHTW